MCLRVCRSPWGVCVWFQRVVVAVLYRPMDRHNVRQSAMAPAVYRSTIRKSRGYQAKKFYFYPLSYIKTTPLFRGGGGCFQCWRIRRYLIVYLSTFGKWQILH